MIKKIKFLTILALLSFCGVAAASTEIPEPSTVIYGKVLHRAYGNEHLLTEGHMEWTLRDENGAEFTYSAEMEDIQGTFSYKISIPHQAFSTGLNVDPSVIPLGVGEASYEFVSISVDGFPAAVLWSEVDFLSLIQNSRAATHRIDLLVSFDLLDTDGDGIPDWWEKFYGLDWQTPDGGLDSDSDGLNNLAEYLGGTHPLHDDRVPSVSTQSIAAYGQSNNGVWLRGVDADTPAAGLEYTLTSLPAGGHLHILPATEAEDQPLAVGATFTQEQLDQGEVAYRHTDPHVSATEFSVRLADGINTSADTLIAVSIFPPSPLQPLEVDAKGIPFWWGDESIVFEAYWELRQNVLSGDLVESALLYLLGKDYGWTLWDERAESLPLALAMSGAGSHIVLGGTANDDLRGGDDPDIINGGFGTDTLYGAASADMFVVGDTGLEILGDFDPAEDILDVRDLLAGRTGSLDDYLRVSFNGLDSTIGVDQSGSGTNYTDAAIRLVGVELDQAGLHILWSNGQLLTGLVQGLPSVEIVGWPTDAIEEGFDSATLTLRRRGPVDLPLSITLTITGSAANGVDYDLVSNAVTFQSGDSTSVVVINPLPDSVIEGLEQVNLSLAQGEGYVLGSTASGQVGIADAKQRFSIQAVEALTAVGGDPALLLLTRQGPIHTATTVFLEAGGSAVRDLDYVSLPTFISFTSYQTDMVIPVSALGAGSLSQEEASRNVEVSIKPSSTGSYLLGHSPAAQVRLVSDLTDFASWAEETNTDTSVGMEALKTTTSTRTGLQVLLEYALSYGVDFGDGVSAEEQGQFIPKVTQEADGLHIEFRKRLDDGRLNYVIQRSSDMLTWHSGPAHFESVALSQEKADAGHIHFRVLNSDGQACFVRVLVELNE